MDALLYVRVSSEEQVKFGLSIDAQIKDLTDYCNNNNLHILAIYKDEGISGSTIEKREAFKKMVDDAQNGDIILFTKLDRFSRNLLDANNTVQKLDKKGVMIKAIFEDDIDTSTADGKFIFNLKLSLAQREREKTSERIQDVFRYKESIGEVVSGSCPLGYKIENKHLVIDNETADIVRFIYDTYNKCNSLHQTWNDTCSKFNVSRTPRTIKNILKNEKYIGKSKDNEHYCEPLVDKELFYDVQEKLSRNIKKAPSKNTYLFSNLIKCPCCGRNLYAHGYSDNKKRTYYHCASRNYIYGHKCDFKYIREDELEDMLLNTMQEFARKERDRYENSADSVQQFIDKKKSIEDKIKRLKEVYIDGGYDKNEYKAKLSRFEADIRECDKNIRDNSNSSVNDVLKLNIKELYNEISKDGKREFWHRYVSRIEITDDKKIKQIYFL